ncbi:uncharacterized protein in proB 3'region isoform X2 [Patella vulgata]|uniref:uncharacterized protein in proB 3'region isoform X2 n=1 Tax=Patella vulgata TaxID=6465 RepID=UPI00217FCA70|nr:uncharacterized protein in proB 3'region isoform X2 [Patella vulgata]
MMEDLRILVVCHHAGVGDYIQRIQPNLKFYFVYLERYGIIPTDEELEGITDINVCFGSQTIYEKIITKYPNIKWFHSITAGNEIPFAIWREQGKPPPFIYTRIYSLMDVTIPQYILSYILWSERKILELYEKQRKKEWAFTVMDFRPLEEVRVGILGLGFIGKPTAKLCKSLSMKVIAMSRRPVPIENRESYIDEYKLLEGLEDLLSTCDYIVNLLPSTHLTVGLLNGDVLSACKKKPVFINVGRGDIINEHSIINALRNGWISKAILDVFEREPLPTKSPLWEEPGVFITYHTAYGLYREEHFQKLIDDFLENCQRFVQKRPLVGEVDVENGY